MPLLPFTHQQIVVPVAPKTTASGAVLFAQTAVFSELHLTGAASGPVHLELVTVPVYSLGSGEAVPDGLGIKPEPVKLTATNDWAVYYDAANPAHPRNGQPLYYRGGVAPNEWCFYDEAGGLVPLVDGLEAAPEPLRLQGDWAEMLLFSLLGTLIRSNMEAANRPPFNRYA